MPQGSGLCLEASSLWTLRHALRVPRRVCPDNPDNWEGRSGDEMRKKEGAGGRANILRERIGTGMSLSQT